MLLERVDLPDTQEKRVFRQWMKENLSRFAYPLLGEDGNG